MYVTYVGSGKNADVENALTFCCTAAMAVCSSSPDTRTWKLLGSSKFGRVERVRDGDAAVAKNLAKLRAQAQTDAGARHVRQQRLLAVQRALQQTHVADFEAIVNNGVLPVSQRCCVSKQAIDHVDVASNQRQAAANAASYVQLCLWNRDPYADVLGDVQLCGPNGHTKFHP